MEIVVTKRFSEREKDGKLKFYEVSPKSITVEKKLGEAAIAAGYAKANSVEINNNIKNK